VQASYNSHGQRYTQRGYSGFFKYHNGPTFIPQKPGPQIALQAAGHLTGQVPFSQRYRHLWGPKKMKQDAGISPIKCVVSPPQGRF